MPGYTVKIDGLEELQRGFRLAPVITERESKRAMNESVIDVVREVKPLVPVYRGTLRNSIASEVQGSGPKIRGIVGSTLKDEEYPAVMEFGRRPGAKMPPPDALIPWVTRVLKVKKSEAPAVAWIVARSIGKKGIKGRRFLRDGFQAALPRIKDRFAAALERIVKGIADAR